jgi:acyl carrier protein
MNQIAGRLTRCFTNVFPDLPPDEIPNTSITSLASWDSAAHVTLLSAVSEEFSLDIPLDDFEDLTSFALIADYIAHHGRTDQPA